MKAQDKIKRTREWQSGETVGPLRLAKATGVKADYVGKILKRWVLEGEAQYLGRGVYRKRPPRHWIHTRPLARRVAA